jgi:hypothetical protein
MKALYTLEAAQELNKDTFVSDEERDRKHPGEDDLVWCVRCKCNHRKGAPWPVEEARIVKRLSEKLLEEINAETIRELRNKI